MCRYIICVPKNTMSSSLISWNLTQERYSQHVSILHSISPANVKITIHRLRRSNK